MPCWPSTPIWNANWPTRNCTPMPRNVNLSKREADASVTIDRPTTDSFVTSKLAEYRLLPYAAPAYLEQRAPIRDIVMILAGRAEP